MRSTVVFKCPIGLEWLAVSGFGGWQSEMKKRSRVINKRLQEINPALYGSEECSDSLLSVDNISEKKILEQKFNGLLESVPDSMVIVSEQGNIILVNSQTEKMFGYRREELLGQLVDKLVPDSVQCTPVFAKSTMRTMGTGLNFYALRKDGTEFPVDISLSSLETEVGLLIVAVIRDVSVRKQLADKLQQDKELFQTMLNRLSDSVWAIDDQDRFLIVNESAQKIIGTERMEGPIDTWSESYGFYLSDTITLHPPQDLPLVRAMRGETVKDAEVFIRNPGLPAGAWFSVNGGPVHIDGVGTVGLIVARDITDCKQAQRKQLALAQELRRSNAELQQFATIASHDLQEPLRAVIDCLKIIEQTYKGRLDDKADKLIHYAVDGALHMRALIDDLLLLSHITEERTKQSTDLSAVLKTVLKNLKISIKESGAKITYDPLPLVLGDRTQLVQLLQNLISNAIKFRSSKAPQIHIGVQRQQEHWLLSVHDNGIGFKQEHLERIFLPFKRLHRRNKYPGTGIGLTICRKIVEWHAGAIWAESKLEKGTTFYFTLPVNIGESGVY
jgi:PAS domain S-box-containing protein